MTFRNFWLGDGLVMFLPELIRLQIVKRDKGLQWEKIK